MLSTTKYSKILKIAIYLFITATAIFLLSNFVLAATGPEVGLNYAEGTGLDNSKDIRVIIVNIIRVVIGFLGIIAVGLIMYAGWLWMTSEGNDEKIEQAKSILKNAVIGLIIILSSFAIASFILNVLNNGSGNGSGGGTNVKKIKSGGLSALGSGIIQSLYPAPNQKDVPRNTSVIITFRESILAKTLCETTDMAVDARCDGEAINKDVIRIFELSEAANCAFDYSVTSGCTSLVEAKVYSSADNKNFVFVPNSYLGSPLELINYSVYLSNGLLRQSGEKAFPSLSEPDYGWSFEVSDKIDLSPPQVRQKEVFPAPDDIKDTMMAVSAAGQAEGAIIVNSAPLIYSDAKVLSVSPGGGSSNASATVDKNCDQNDTLTINVDLDGTVKLKDSGNNLLGQGVVSGKIVSFNLCNLKLTLDSGNFISGNLWTVNLMAKAMADTITVGDATYIAANTENGFYYKVGPTNAETAQSINNVLVNSQEVVAARAGNIITVKAKAAGVAGNSIVLSGSNSSALAISPMTGGADKEDKVKINGKKDQPMNAAIQINFNEAIMPFTVSGTSDELKDSVKVVNADPAAKSKNAVCTADADCKSFICDGGVCAGDNEYLKGKFVISNQYRTVNFLSDKECGFNTCGEKIYCLPANSHLRVDLSAASLTVCTTNNDCQDKSPFNICDSVRKFCRDSENNYFPQAAKDKPNIVDGIVDAAFNSLDGNRDNYAYGPVSYYNENTPADISRGDSYQWSFFISDKFDLTPPKIKAPTTPATGEASVNSTGPVKLSFDKLMLSSRLTTGSLTINNGKQNILHYLLNLRNFIDQPLGYWITSTDQQSIFGGEIDSTDVYINHTPFNQASSYKAQAGSGLKDIYQNCFLPCSSDSLTGNPSCCNGAAYDKESCP